MTPTFVAVLPAIIPDLARRCIQSMAPELRARLLLVDNTDTGEIAEEHHDAVKSTCAFMGNQGVTRAWNLGARCVNVLDADWLYIVSQSMTFGAAGGRDLLDAAGHANEQHIAHSQYGWHALLLHRRVWERVGLFDPVFPSYGNESDLLYRMGLADLPSPRENDGTFTQVVMNASCEPPAACLRSGVVQIDYSEHLRRYRDKWRGAQGEETTVHPYGDESLDYWFTGEYEGAKR